MATTYHAWRGEKDAGEYRDVPGFCKSASTGEIKEHGNVLTPGRYVGAAEIEDDGIPFEEKMAGLSAHVIRAVRRGRQARRCHQEEPEGLGVWGEIDEGSSIHKFGTERA